MILTGYNSINESNENSKFKPSEFMIKAASGNYVDRDALFKYLKDNDYKFVAGTYRDANHNRQGYQYVFYNGESYIEFHRSGGNPDGSEILKMSSTMPKTPSYKFQSNDTVHDLKKESKSSSRLDQIKSAGLLDESVIISESTYDADEVDWNKISKGDVVIHSTKGMTDIPKVGNDFKVGPLRGKCIKNTGSKVYMKVERNAYGMNDSIYNVSGATPTGYGDYTNHLANEVTNPAKAIEQWFKIGVKNRTFTDITTTKKSDAIKLVTWANENQDKIIEWYKKYGCPYKLDYLLQAISDQVKNKCSSFYENEFGDSVYPFSVG